LEPDLLAGSSKQDQWNCREKRERETQRKNAFPCFHSRPIDPTNGMVAIFMVQCPGPDQWAARDLFLKTATEVFKKVAP